MHMLPTTKKSLKIDSRFVVEATPNSYNCYIYSLFVGDQYVLCLGIDGIQKQDGSFERYTEKQAFADAEKFASDVLGRMESGKPYKRGEKGMATSFLNA